MEGEQAAFDGQAYGDQADGGAEGSAILPGFGKGRDGFTQAGKQQMTGDVIKDGHAKKKETRADEAENHIPHGGQGGAADLTDHQNAAGGQGTDLNEHIAGENIVGIAEHQQGGLDQVHHHKVELTFAFLQIQLQPDLGTLHAKKEHHGEHKGEEAFQQSQANFVAPGVGEMAHDVGDGSSVLQHQPHHK